MLNLASKYGLKYTGVMIENYEDKTDGEIRSRRTMSVFNILEIWYFIRVVN